MKFGASFPSTEIGNNPADIRAFAIGVENIGFDFLTCIDHVVQSGEAVADDWRSYYVLDNPFHEVITLFGFIAALTERIELVTSILILPQRQTVLVAKQLAELDVLSSGRLRAGFGIGWNELEFDALGQGFRTRARRMEEQIALLRQLWSQRTVRFEGEFDTVLDAGINPRPVRQPIPVWLGAFKPPAIERAARIADGWLLNPRVQPGAEADELLAAYRGAAVAAGRDPSTLGLEATIFTTDKTPGAVRAEYEAWRERGITHVTLRTMTAGHTSVAGHLDSLAEARQAIA